MKFSALSLCTAAIPAIALLSPVDSPCAVNCGNVLSATASDEIQCSQGSFGSGTGAIFKSCVDCQVDSDYYDSEITDTAAALYNLRYASAYCLFGKPDGEPLASPCITSTACGPLLDALDFENLQTNTSSYDYCSLWRSEDVSRCQTCLSAASQNYLGNYVSVLNIACSQLPTNGSLLSFDGSIFSTTTLNATAPNPASTYTAESFIHNGLPLSAKVGIAFAVLVFLLALAGSAIIVNGKRRRRAYLRTLEKKPQVAWGGPTIPGSPEVQAKTWRGMYGGGWSGVNMSMSMGMRGAGDNSTPLSQKPLRSWDDSPLSAHGNAPFAGTPVTPVAANGRYFSPYSSQYNSPTDLHGTPNLQPLGGAGWQDMGPGELEVYRRHMAAMEAGREREREMEMERQGEGQGVKEVREIGLALRGEVREEGIELMDVRRGGETPVLMHPGTGRGTAGESVPRTYEPEGRGA